MTVRNFYWLYEGVIAGSGLPGGEMNRRAAFPFGASHGESLDSDLRWLKHQGIGAILSLTEAPLPADALAEHALVVTHLPIDDQTAPSMRDFLAALDFIDQQVGAGRGVLVHCRVGEGRTASILAAYLIRQGAIPQEALAQLRAIRPGAISASAQEAALQRFASGREWII
ncbi:MAG TPA: dual specificity protein phosphatase family protein [Ktedonobacterales bacterium]